MIPLGYQVHRQMINFLQYLLIQPDSSLHNRVFIAQKQNPSRGDWVQNVTKLIYEYDINMTSNEILNMKPSLYKGIVKRKVHTQAVEDIFKEKNYGQNSSFIKYKKKKLEMATYFFSKA